MNGFLFRSCLLAALIDWKAFFARDAIDRPNLSSKISCQREQCWTMYLLEENQKLPSRPNSMKLGNKVARSTTQDTLDQRLLLLLCL